MSLQPTASGAPGLDDVCRWAWTACVGPLIEAVHSTGTGPARIVLVPTAALALVPWHAAFNGHEGERRYALEDLCISYGVSARGLRDTAAQSTSDSGPVLVVGNPSGDLPFAGTEARAIHDAFHPRGTFLGDGEPVLPQDVLDWIATAPAGPSVLHFACHGAVVPDRPADAHLVLSGGHRLAVRTLIDASRLAALNIDRVFLAACTTNVIGSDHDEALSLSTAFLAAGARTVFGSLWPVPDEHTSALMFMVHHYLYRSRLRPADALREAQRWMLNPHRAVPAEMPERLAATSRDDRIADPQAWAGFTHLGR
jgi:CHAT domain-containing protein